MSGERPFSHSGPQRASNRILARALIACSSSSYIHSTDRMCTMYEIRFVYEYMYSRLLYIYIYIYISLSLSHIFIKNMEKKIVRKKNWLSSIVLGVFVFFLNFF